MRACTSRCPAAASSFNILSASATESEVSVAARTGVSSPWSLNALSSSRSLDSAAIRSGPASLRPATPLASRPMAGKIVQPKTKMSQKSCGTRDSTRTAPSAAGTSTESATATWALGPIFSVSIPRKSPDPPWCSQVLRRDPNPGLRTTDDLPHICSSFSMVL